MSAVPMDERPYEFAAQFPVIGNTFFWQQDPVVMTVSAGSWIGERKTLKFTASVKSAAGEVRTLSMPDLELLDGASRRVALPFDEPGPTRSN